VSTVRRKSDERIEPMNDTQTNDTASDARHRSNLFSAEAIWGSPPEPPPPTHEDVPAAAGGREKGLSDQLARMWDQEEEARPVAVSRPAPRRLEWREVGRHEKGRTTTGRIEGAWAANSVRRRWFARLERQA
jgi:hypothetical protein